MQYSATATAIVAAYSMICSCSVMQANVVNSKLGSYSYGGCGAAGPQTYRRVSLIGGRVPQHPAARASVTRSAVSVPVPCGRPPRLRVSRIGPSRPFRFRPAAAVYGARTINTGTLDRLSQKLVNHYYYRRAADSSRCCYGPGRYYCQ